MPVVGKQPVEENKREAEAETKPVAGKATYRPSCVWCYAPDAQKQCGRCRKRWFCSRACQVKDWKIAMHKKFCGHVTEKGVDWDVMEAPGKGHGVFTLRDLKRGDIILVEKAALEYIFPPHELPADLPPGARDEIMRLTPEDGTVFQKLQNNQFEAMSGNETSTVFITVARLNHSCLPNCEVITQGDGTVTLISLNCDLEKGKELTINYLGLTDQRGGTAAQQAAMLRKKWGFDCDCPAHKDPELARKMESISVLDKQLIQSVKAGKLDRAIGIGHKLLQLYDDLHVGLNAYARTYYDMFQAAVLQGDARRRQAKKFARQAYEHHILRTKYETPEIRKEKTYAENPELHPAYGKHSTARSRHS